MGADRDHFYKVCVDAGVKDLVSPKNVDSDKKLEKLLDKQRCEKVETVLNTRERWCAINLRLGRSDIVHDERYDLPDYLYIW